jgi:toxin ParE1/3/4
MPNCRVNLTKDAERALVEIGQHTKKTWGRAQSLRYLKQLKDSFDTLAVSPKIGNAREDIAQDLRSYVCGEHVLYYYASPACLIVVHILHQRMDPLRHLMLIP